MLCCPFTSHTHTRNNTCTNTASASHTSRVNPFSSTDHQQQLSPPSTGRGRRSRQCHHFLSHPWKCQWSVGWWNLWFDFLVSWWLKVALLPSQEILFQDFLCMIYDGTCVLPPWTWHLKWGGGAGGGVNVYRTRVRGFVMCDGKRWWLKQWLDTNPCEYRDLSDNYKCVLFHFMPIIRHVGFYSTLLWRCDSVL